MPDYPVSLGVTRSDAAVDVNGSYPAAHVFDAINDAIARAFAEASAEGTTITGIHIADPPASLLFSAPRFGLAERSAMRGRRGLR